ncbi:FAD-binding domain-containing protein [Micromonospora sp. AMSO31t]|uniref:FAD-binding domain-containing protein n=1 Tax=Micromonospora sp. AMSO31t TaxID=2650566 RepID=UPI001788D20A
MSDRTAVVLLTRDLRVHDHPALASACSAFDRVVPLYVLDPDWRPGVAVFFRWLLDGDVPDNSGNWQWVAGTGNDARPHRGFNPVRRAERYDPDGAYVRRHVPELASIEGATMASPAVRQRRRQTWYATSAARATRPSTIHSGSERMACTRATSPATAETTLAATPECSVSRVAGAGASFSTRNGA